MVQALCTNALPTCITSQLADVGEIVNAIWTHEQSLDAAVIALLNMISHSIYSKHPMNLKHATPNLIEISQSTHCLASTEDLCSENPSAPPREITFFSHKDRTPLYHPA